MTLARSSLLLAVLVGATLATPARAVPLFFEGNLGMGFDPADPDVVALGIDLVFGAGDAIVLPAPPFVETELVGAPVVPAVPSVATPIVANVRYTVTNTTASVLDGDYLVFSSGDTVGAYPELTPDELGIDVPGILLLQTATCMGNPGGPCVFGAVALPVMAPGAELVFEIQHVMRDTLSGNTVIPSPAVALLDRTEVPEPAVTILLGVGLAAGAAARRRRARV